MAPDGKTRLEACGVPAAQRFEETAHIQPDPLAWLAHHAGSLTERVKALEHRLACIEARQKRTARK